MGTEASGPDARLQALARAKERAAGLKRGAILSAEPMAEMLELSWAGLRKWTREIEGFTASGAFEIGGNGREYRFRPMKTVNFLIKHFEKVRRAQVEKARRQRELIGGEALKAAPVDYNLDELAKIIRLQREIREERVRSGALVDAAVAAAAIRQYHSTLQEALLRSAQEQDPNGRWPPDVRDSFEDAIRNALVSMETAARGCLRALGQA